MGQLHDPAQFPELASLRQRILAWRFYHQFRTDEQSSLRQPQLGVFTPVLGHDGRDLAAALQTIVENGHGPAGEQAIDHWLDRAFPGTRLSIAEARAPVPVPMSRQCPGCNGTVANRP